MFYFFSQYIRRLYSNKRFKYLSFLERFSNQFCCCLYLLLYGYIQNSCAFNLLNVAYFSNLAFSQIGYFNLVEFFVELKQWRFYRLNRNDFQKLNRIDQSLSALQSSGVLPSLHDLFYKLNYPYSHTHQVPGGLQKLG